MDYPGFQLKGDMMVRWKKKIKWAWLLVKYTIYRVQNKKRHEMIHQKVKQRIVVRENQIESKYGHLNEGQDKLSSGTYCTKS